MRFGMLASVCSPFREIASFRHKFSMFGEFIHFSMHVADTPTDDDSARSDDAKDAVGLDAWKDTRTDFDYARSDAVSCR